MGDNTASNRLELPESCTVPLRLDTDQYRLLPLAEIHTDLDYAAVMETAERLRAGAPNGWPRVGFSVAENRIDLRRHEQEFADRISFAYTVLSLDEREVLGCVYFNPPATSAFDVDVHMWVREREYPGGLAQHLHRHVDAWLHAQWPFKRINYLRPDYYFAQGSCLCEQVTFYAGPVSGPFELCHCSRCRRSSGSAFAAMVGVDEVRFSKGRELVATCSLPILSQPPAFKRCFCKTCGAPLPDPETDGWQEIPAGSLQTLDLTPDRHIYVDHAPGWSHTETRLPCFTQDEIRQFRETQP